MSDLIKNIHDIAPHIIIIVVGYLVSKEILLSPAPNYLKYSAIGTFLLAISIGWFILIQEYLKKRRKAL